jgi:hypothetical protein
MINSGNLLLFTSRIITLSNLPNTKELCLEDGNRFSETMAKYATTSKHHQPRMETGFATAVKPEDFYS